MNKPTYFCQWDARWGNTLYTSIGNSSQTIATSGCGITCMAMILATWVDKKISPNDTAKSALNMGCRTANEGTSWDYFGMIAAKYNLKFKQTATTSEAVTALKAGALVVCSMGPGYFTKHGHFILAWNTDNNYIYVNDPNHQEKIQASIQLFREQCIQYFIFYKSDTTASVHIMKKGDSGEDVKLLQGMLNKIGLNCGVADGIFGNKTEFAVRKFQEKYKIVADGIVGPATLGKLKVLAK